MSKTILLLDKPENCDYCPVGRIFGMDGQVECMTSKDIRVNNNGRIIPDWCPLKEIPDKITEENRWFGEEYSKGYNACIDEILKEFD